MDTNRDLAGKVEALEKKYDEQFAEVFAAIKELIAPPARRRALRDRCLISSVYSQCTMFECPRQPPLPSSTLFRRSP